MRVELAQLAEEIVVSAGLFDAARKNHQENHRYAQVVRLLLEHGANTNARDANHGVNTVTSGITASIEPRRCTHYVGSWRGHRCRGRAGKDTITGGIDSRTGQDCAIAVRISFCESTNVARLPRAC